MAEYVVYCDESCHDLSQLHDFMAIGGLWVVREAKPALLNELRNLRGEIELFGEIKWQKTSRKYLDRYQKVVDFFFDSSSMQYRVIVVEQKRVDYDKYHRGDEELGFYKFYYEMLIKWLWPGHKFLILLDFKRNRGANRFKTLQAVLENALGDKERIIDLNIIDSSETPLAQICDLITGAVAASYNGIPADTPKAQLARYIAQRCGRNSLALSTIASESKLNVFRIELGRK